MVFDLASIMEYIKPELTIVAVVMYVIGFAIKKSAVLKNEIIPLVIGILSIVFTAIYVFATTTITTNQDILMAIFLSLVQGILCASPSVFVDQTIKQTKKLTDNKG